MTRALFIPAVLCLFFPAATLRAVQLDLPARQRVEKAPGVFEPVEKRLAWDSRKTAMVVCDMWDRHWCESATARVGEMAPRMNDLLKAARAQGVFIIHCPSDTMKFYEGTPARLLARQAPKAEAKVPLQRWCNLDPSREAPLPIDDTDGGCDDASPSPKGPPYPWTRQIATIEILPGDAVTDSAEAYHLLEQRGIENVIVMGVHLNMCVLGRPFSIRQMVAQGKNVALVRDLTDTMYNPARRPFVSHFTGTDLMIEHVEKYWCPTITSAAFPGGKPFEFQGSRRPRVLFLIGDAEYKTGETVPAWAKEELAWRGVECQFVTEDPTRPGTFPGLEQLPQADALFVSLKRRGLPPKQLALIRAHAAAGKPVIGIRTASHAFDPRPVPKGLEAWENFDREIFGGHYQNHYGKGPGTLAERAGESLSHPILRGWPSNAVKFSSHLYKCRNLAPNTRTLLNGRLIEPEGVTEPMAWIYTNDSRRSFYTSLGAPEDFQEPAFRRLLLHATLWSLGLPIPPSDVSIPVKAAPAPAREPERKTAKVPVRGHAWPAQDKPFPPLESAGKFTVPENLEIELVLSEPEITQPVFLNFDERGRMWVVEYRQYPAPAGLRVVSKDEYWRAVYDRVPEPPPWGPRGRDRISIHEDTTGDGRYDRHTVFVDGLNIATAVVKGRGGAWVMNPPYLLFYPDANEDDVPDGPPVVHLEGFGLEDTHSVANSLRWGPDGWLYGAQGSTVSGRVRRPGDPESTFTQGQNIWRYHPGRRLYEVFSEGGGNAFGVEMDTEGRIFSGHNGGDTRGFHYMQGAYLQKGFGKHGPLSNPHAYGYFPAMVSNPTERFTHTFAIYGEDALPSSYRGKLFGVEPLQGRVVLSEITPEGSTFRTRDLQRVVTSADGWFRPVDIKVGPEGALYIADWYDRYVTHTRNQDDGLDVTHGRIYRLKARGMSANKPPTMGRNPEALLQAANSRNSWERETALRLLADKRDAEVGAAALRKLFQAPVAGTPARSVGFLWAAHLSGTLDEAAALRALDHPEAQVRLWAVRLLGDSGDLSSPAARRWHELAVGEPNIEVRAQLACSARRLPPAAGLPVVSALLRRDADGTDPRLPLLCWWALETHCGRDPAAVLNLFEDASFWAQPTVRNHILERVMRRLASGDSPDLAACTRLLELSPTRATSEHLMTGFEEAYRGRSLLGLPAGFLAAASRHGVGSPAFNVRRGESSAIAVALRTIADPRAKGELRGRYMEALSEVRATNAIPLLLKVAVQPGNEGLRQTALTALLPFDDTSIPVRILEAVSSAPDPVRRAMLTLLASRRVWAGQLLARVRSGGLAASLVPRETVMQLHQYGDELALEVKRLWPHSRPAPNAEMEASIQRYATLLQAREGDPYAGKKLFQNACSSCHTLFAQGGRIGPDLTPYQRSDLRTLLLHVINPSAEIREGFESLVVETKDERSITGFRVTDTPALLVLRGVNGQDVALRREEIASTAASGMSLMPEGLLEALNDTEVCDLFAYLRSSQPLNN